MFEQRDRYVYVIDDEHGQPCYIGVGKGLRMHDHVRMAKYYRTKYPNSAKAEFISDCLARGFIPQPYKVAENLTIKEASEYETTLISWYGRRDLGTGILFNASAGGFGVKNMSERTRSKIWEGVRNAMAGQEFRDNLSKKATAKFARPGIREKVAAKTREAWKTEEFRAKFFAVSKSKWTPERRAQQAERTRIQLAASGGPAMKGKKHSAESLQKMRDSSQKVWDATARERAADRMRGKKLSQETRARMRESHRISREARVLAQQA